MKKNTAGEDRDWEEAGAVAFIDHAMPVIREASKTGESNNVLYAYAGVLGAWFGSLTADAGPEQAGEIADIMFQNVRAISFKEQMN